MESSSRTIAKNTAFLYFRMILVMLVTLYTSRVILEVLGVDDYGLYQAVGGIVGFLAFINNALSTGTSRFLTYALGVGDDKKLRETFSTTLSVHIIIALLIVCLAETVGLWYVYNKMVIPDEKFTAAVFTFHASIIAAFFSLILVPYSASIIAHEKMSFFAYLSIADVTLKLGAVFMLAATQTHRLEFYGILLLVIQILIFLCYYIYCRRFFNETKVKLSIDKGVFKEIFAFSGWSLFANGSIALNNQGIILLLNLFFAPTVVVARTISLQVNSAANQLVNSFRTAVNPQIVKKLAAGDVAGSHDLLLQSTKFSYFLMLVICLPFFLLAEPILQLWLGEIPEYSTIFVQIILIQSLFQVFDTSFYTALYALGRIRENALISPTVGFLTFPIVYVFFKLGYSPVIMSWAFLIGYVLLGILIKPFLIVKIADYRWRDIWSVFRSSILVTVVSVPIPLLLSFVFNVKDSIINSVMIFIVSVITVVLSVWLIGLTPTQRKGVRAYLNNKISKK